MGWFKKFIKEIKDEWQRINTDGTTNTNEIDVGKAIEDIKSEIDKQLDNDEVNTVRQAMINYTALVNLGIERYGMPIIVYGGRKYTAKALHTFIIKKDSNESFFICDNLF